MKHFLSLLDLTATEAEWLLRRTVELKQMQKNGVPHRTLAGKTLGMIFDKASTRTRVSFEVGMYQLGGHALFLHSGVSQIGRGEPIADTARVLSRMVDAIMIRTFAHDSVVKLAEYSSVPVINGLTDLNHPCQVLADIFTWYERRGSIRGKTVCWIGDDNNMAHSWINGSAIFGYKVRLAIPKAYAPGPAMMASYLSIGADVELSHNPLEAAEGADIVTTDVWASMGQEEEQQQRAEEFAGYQVNSVVMAAANPDALFMHCLPAHRGEEVTADVIDGPQSVVWDEAENRLHAQKALLEMLLRQP